MNRRFAHDEQAELERRGLIATNNFGLRMDVYDAGPDSALWQFYAGPLLSNRNRELLEKARTTNPELWNKAVATFRLARAAVSGYAELLHQHGPANTMCRQAAAASEELKWVDYSLRTQVFDILDEGNLTPEEALALCT